MTFLKQAQKRNQSESGGLAYSLELKINGRVMLTTNINIEDRLINGQIGTVKHIEIKGNEVRTIYLELDDKCAGQIRMNGSDIIAKNNKWVPIKREETYIYLNKYKTTSPAIKENTVSSSAIMGKYDSQGAGFKFNVSSFQLRFGKSEVV